MRKCKKSALLAAAAAFALTGARVRADFSVSAVRVDLDAVNSTTTNGNGPISGNYALVEFFAENLGAAGAVNQGSRLETVSITMTDASGGNLVVGGYSGTGTPAGTAQADLFGANEIAVSGGSYIFKELNISTTGAPKYVSAVNMLGDPTVSGDNNPQQTLNTFGFTPTNAYSNYSYGVNSFSVAYGSTTGGVNATTANGGKGALFAVAVVPVADTVTVSGQLGGDMALVGTNFTHTNAVLPGDANFDGSVNILDLNTLLGHMGTTGTSWSTGDFNGDTSTNVLDLNILLGHIGQTAPTAQPAAAPAPEPGTLAVLAAPALLSLRRNRKKE